MGARNYYQLKPAPLFQEEPKERTCLRCNEKFKSLDGSRICEPCNKRNSTSAKRNDVGGAFRRLGGIAP
jgi:hypothetical protein